MFLKRTKKKGPYSHSISNTMFKITNTQTRSAYVAAFDLDHTLIRPKSRNKNKSVAKFQKDIDDWEFEDNVKYVLKNLKGLNKMYIIVIFTNKSSSENYNVLDFFKIIVNEIEKVSELPVSLYSAQKSYYKKPVPEMWFEFEKDNIIEINKKESFYVGDAAGRTKDFSDCDYKFALNIGLTFFPNDKYFNNKSSSDLVIPRHPISFDKLSEFSLIKPTQSNDQELIVFTGGPASGKSTWAKKFSAGKYDILSTDDIGTLAKVQKICKELLMHGRSVIVDNTNPTKKHRSFYTDLVNHLTNLDEERKIQTRSFFFDVSKEECFHLNTYRGLKSAKYIPTTAIHTYFKNLEVPDESEDFDNFFKIRFQCDFKDPYLKYYLV